VMTDAVIPSDPPVLKEFQAMCDLPRGSVREWPRR
jgi:hypothetical protein